MNCWIAHCFPRHESRRTNIKYFMNNFTFTSTVLTVTQEIPQGSVLGPLLFIPSLHFFFSFCIISYIKSYTVLGLIEIQILGTFPLFPVFKTYSYSRYCNLPHIAKFCKICLSRSPAESRSHPLVHLYFPPDCN